MQTDLATRRAAIRYPHSDLAKAAGVDANTVTRVLAGRDVLASSITKIEQAIAAEELRVLRRLIDLHPQEAMAGLCPERNAA